METRSLIAGLLGLFLLGCGPKWPGNPTPPLPPGPPGPPPADYVDLGALVRRNPGLSVHTYYSAYPSADSAWFAEDHPTRYCVQADHADRAWLLESIAAAAQVWERYIDRRGVIGALTARARDGGVEFKGLSHVFVQVSCDAAPDLIFEAGADPSLAVMRLANDQTYSVSYREAAGPTWSRGRIWLSPTHLSAAALEKGPALSFSILHELGHVLGNPDLMNTVMVPYYVQWMQLLTPLGFQNLSVDLFHSLYLGSAEYTAGGYAPGPGGEKALAKVFASVRGHQAAGKITARVDGGSLLLKDESAEPESATEFSIDLSHGRGTSLGQVFRVGALHLEQKLELVPGALKLPAGDLPLQLTRNPPIVYADRVCASPLRLEFLEGGDFRPFFCASANDLSNEP